MKEYLKKLTQSSLFEGVKEEELQSLLNCLGVKIKHYYKNEYILHVGDAIHDIAVVVDGGVHIIKEDYWGNKTILANVEVGGLFGESYACIVGAEVGVSAVAYQPAVVVFCNVEKILFPCEHACGFHATMVRNFLQVLASKNIALTRKMEHMSQRTTRDKVLSYLSEQAKINNDSQFEIPFNRQQLADYLCVDRSALSKELCCLRKEGYLAFRKNRFQLLG